MLSLLGWRLWRLFAILRFNIVYRPYCLTDIRLPPPPAILKLSFLRQAVNHTIIKQIPNLIKGAGVSWVKLFPDVSCNAVLKQMSKLEKKIVVINPNPSMFWFISHSLSFLKTKCCSTYLWVDQWPWIVSQIALLDIVWKVHDVDLTAACGNGGKQPIHWSSMLNVDIRLSDANAVLVQTLKKGKKGFVILYLKTTASNYRYYYPEKRYWLNCTNICILKCFKTDIQTKLWQLLPSREFVSLQWHVNQIWLESLIPSIYLFIPLREWNALTAKADLCSGLLYRGTHFIYCRNNLEWRCCHDTTHQCCVIMPKQKTYIWIVYRLL